MYPFTYQRPAALSDALAALAADPEARPLSGGMTLLPSMKMRLAAPSQLIDLARLPELRGVEVEGGALVVGAAMRHVEVADSAVVRAALPALAALAGGIGDPQVRARGTLGGSVANNDPAADYPAAMLALDATISTNKRKIAAADFFTGLFETALEDGEIVTSVSFTAPAKAAYEKFRNPASRYAMTGVFVAKGDNGVRVAVTGAGDSGVFRSKEIEAALAGSFSASALAGVTVPSDGLMGDIHASPEYRANLVVVMAKRAVAAASA